MGVVKKLSKQSESAADHAQIDNTSSSVWANFAEVRQRPSGRPKYSSCRQDGAIRYEYPSSRSHQTHVYRNHDVNQRERCEYYDQSSIIGIQYDACGNGLNAATHGELPRIPVTSFRSSVRRIRMAMARAAVVNVILTKRKS